MILKRTSLQMEAEAIQELLQGGVLTNMTPGGRVRSILSAVSKQNGNMMDALDVNTAMGFATSATGYFLDLWGRSLGVDRASAIACFSNKEDQSVRFYVTVGVLKDYVVTGIIPSGTLIQSANSTIEYSVTENTPFPDNATETYVPVIAAGSGEQYRVGRGMLTVHNLGDPNVYVTNDKSISNGGDQESDANYRYRILNHLSARVSGNTTAIRLAALSTPGVADVVLSRYLQGPGTVDVLLTPVGNRVTDAMIGGAQARIDRISAGGDFVTVRGPRYVLINLRTRIDFTRDVPEEDKPDIRRAVERAQLDYLDDIPLGGQLVIQELRARTQEASEKILDHEVLCFGIDNVPHVMRNYRLFEDELFLPNSDVADPIEVI